MRLNRQNIDEVLDQQLYRFVKAGTKSNGFDKLRHAIIITIQEMFNAGFDQIKLLKSLNRETFTKTVVKTGSSKRYNYSEYVEKLCHTAIKGEIVRFLMWTSPSLGVADTPHSIHFKQVGAFREMVIEALSDSYCEDNALTFEDLETKVSQACNSYWKDSRKHRSYILAVALISLEYHKIIKIKSNLGRTHIWNVPQE